MRAHFRSAAMTAVLIAAPVAAQKGVPGGRHTTTTPEVTLPAPPPVAPLAPTETLADALADAYANNPRLQAQRAELRELDETVIQAASPYRLNLGVVGSLSYQEGPSQDFFGDLVRVRSRNYGAALTASQILFNGGRTAAQVSAAEADVLAGREQLREAENLILLEVVDSYVSVRRDQELVSIQQQSVDSYQRQVEQAQARERAGDLTRTDIAQAEAQLQIARASLSQAQATLEQSRARYAVVVGRNPGVLAPEPPLPGVPLSLDSAYQIAEHESPTLWGAIMSQRAGKERVAAERAERNFQLTAEGRFGATTYNTLRSSDLRRDAAAGLTLTLPILAQGIIGSRVRQASAAEQRLAFLVEDTRRSVDQQLLASWNTSITARDQLAAGDAAVQAAEAALEGVRRGFAEGFRSNFEVLDSEQRLLNARLIVASARYARYAGQASLLAYLGRLEAATLTPSVQQYDPAANLARQRRSQFGPLQLLLQPIDRIQKPSGAVAAAPTLPVATAPSVAPATAPPPEGALQRTLPVTPSGVPATYSGPPPE